MIVLKSNESFHIQSQRISGALRSQAKETETAAGAKRGKTNGIRDAIVFYLATDWLQQCVLL